MRLGDIGGQGRERRIRAGGREENGAGGRERIMR